MKMAMINPNSDSMDLLQELRSIAPEVWKSNKRNLILPKTLGGLNKSEYVEAMQDKLCELNKYKDMFNAGLIDEMEYESKKAEILFWTYP